MDQPLALAHGLAFQDLYSPDGLLRVDAAFVDSLHAADAALAQRLEATRAAHRAGERGGPAPGPYDEAALLIELAPHVDAFVGALFGIGDALAGLRRRHHELDPLYEVKTKFVRREAAKLRATELEGFDADAALRQIEAWLGEPF